jgi:hypothetical protein
MIEHRHGMMSDSEVRRPTLNPSQETVRRQIQRHHEMDVNVRPFRGYLEGTRHPQNDIGLTQLPTITEFGRRREVLRGTFGAPQLDPMPNRFNLRLGQSTYVGKITVTLARFPRWHLPQLNHLTNQIRSLFHLPIGQQAERRDLPRTMTSGAMLQDDRCHVSGEGRFGSQGSSEQT